MAVYFGEKATFASRTPTRTLPTRTATPTPSRHPPPPPSPPPPKSRNIGAIVGGTLGGIAVLLLAIGLIWFCLRKHKSRDKGTSPPPPPPGYISDEKQSVTSPAPPSSVGSPSITGGYSRQSPSITTQPPTEHPYYHPAHIQPSQFGREHVYPAPADRHEAARVTSYEMPTVKSPQAPDIIEPKPIRGEE
jgi:hypothetical protein